MTVIRTTAAMTAVFCANAILVLGYGLAGMSGHMVITAAVLAAPLAVLLLVWARVAFEAPVSLDWAFLAFLGLVAASTMLNGKTTDLKDYALLAISLGGYPAFRFVDHRFDRRLFIYLVGALAAAGTLATLLFLSAPSDAWLGNKPPVFGFVDGATQFLIALCFLIFAFTSINLSWHKAFVICGLIAIPCMVFSAAMVRHPFVGLISALVMLAIVARRRRQIALICSAVVLMVVGGWMTQPKIAQKLLGFTMERSVVGSHGACDINTHNSIAIRQVLIQQSIRRIADAGPLGFGIGSFARSSCFATYPHNIVLQAGAEIGLAGAALIVLLIVLGFRRVTPLTAFDPLARFVFAGLVFAVFESMVSGSLTGATALFALLGWCAGLTSQRGITPPAVTDDPAASPSRP